MPNRRGSEQLGLVGEAEKGNVPGFRLGGVGALAGWQWWRWEAFSGGGGGAAVLLVLFLLHLQRVVESLLEAKVGGQQESWVCRSRAER